MKEKKKPKNFKVICKKCGGIAGIDESDWGEGAGVSFYCDKCGNDETIFCVSFPEEED